ncbi:ComEC/Rec2 family competence protein [Entomospira entomophila]|uniref:ComEC/Rec2 family competence protein n=1 Tax=Entomospira entomophila TaxID=2719988 RepID=A0A968GDG2_9SPIO|nr:ComEC/Rec2 family competence protein [Entomospira entomophilus]NIZ40989.1 ComEC/Rec2 family competence protein [Entomospira entomophilus]WDI35202.1 ComEC/Rec2 family competence protein [Entomospira entomophilus]
MSSVVYSRLSLMLTSHGAWLLLALSLEFVFIRWLWILHLLFVIQAYLVRKRIIHLLVFLILHIIISQYFIRQQHPVRLPVLITSIHHITLYVTQDMQPNALQRSRLVGYTLTVGGKEICVQHKQFIEVILTHYNQPLRRGQIISLDITKLSADDTKLIAVAHGSKLTTNGFIHPIWMYRSHTLDRILHYTYTQLQESAGLFLAVLIGDQSLLSIHTQRLFRNSGLAHLLALSGFHASLLVGLIFFLLKPLPLTLRTLLLIPFIIIHAWLSGFIYTLLRAYFMAITLLYFKILYRDANKLDILAWSSILILLYDWRAIYSSSFHLSFLAIWAILVLYKPMLKVLTHIPLPQLLRKSLAISFAVDLTLNPLVLYLFKEVQIFSFVANFIFPPLFLFYLLLSTLTMITSPLLLTLLHSYEHFLHAILQYFNLYLWRVHWLPILLVHGLLALGVTFYYNRRNERSTRI